MPSEDDLTRAKNMTINSLKLYSKEAIADLVDSSAITQLLYYLASKHIVDNLELSESERAQAISTYLKSKSISTEDDLLKSCAESGTSSERIYANIYMTAKIEKYALQNYGKLSETLFLENKLSLDRVVYSLVRVSSEDLARELFFRLEDDEISLPQAAAQYSQGPERNTAGRVGPISPAKAHPNLSKYLISAEEGQLVGPFHADKYWVILQVESRVQAVYDDLKKKELSMHLYKKQVGDLVRQVLQYISTEFACEA